MLLMIIVISVLICFSYFLMILKFIRGWKNIPSFEPKDSIGINFPVSVIVPCKNEQKNILKLLSSIAQQSYQNFELIIVDDHSTDKTVNSIQSAKAYLPQIRLIHAKGQGKKNALKEGIAEAGSDLIIITDADCIPSYHWIEAIALFQKHFPSDLIICPVCLSGKNNMFSRLQTLEFSSLVGVAAGSSGAGMPILCNGANLAFRKKTWLKFQHNLHDDELSGDDMFLLENVKKAGGRISFMKSEAGIVISKTPDNLQKFIHQRRRWAAKSKLYTDWSIIFVALIVLAISLLNFAFLALTAFKWYYIFGCLGVFVFKYIMDTRFLYLVRRYSQLERIWGYSFVLSVFYPYYIVFTVISALLFKPKTWK